MHACAIATALEFASGASILFEVEMRDYRIIMSRLEIDYPAKPRGTAWPAPNATRRTSED